MIKKEEIFDLVRAYYKENFVHKDYIEGDYIQYGGILHDEKEMINIVDTALDFRLAGGNYHDTFEKKLAKFLNVKRSLLTTSGSSANLIAFMTLTSPLLKDRRINRGDEVITVAAGFPTTINPLIQFGAIPVFVDITIPQYNIDVKMLEQALSKKTKAVIIAHTLGNPFDLKAVKEFCDKNKLWLIEDNCDALGSQYNLDGENKYTGTIGDLGTSSFYPPHHMTMGEGGAVYTSNSILYKIAKSIRDWGRDCACPPGVDNTCNNRFTRQDGELPTGYDHKYVYSHFGYNLKVTEMQAAIGVAQLDKLQTIIDRRRENFDYIYSQFKQFEEKFILPERSENSKPSWFGFLITCKEQVDRNHITKYLEKKGVQTRNLFAGNFIKHPAFDEMRVNGTGYRVIGDLKNTDIVMNNTFWLGVYPGITNKKIDYITKVISEYFNHEYN